jgi:DNA-binding XRE family transcriptional regulator
MTQEELANIVEVRRETIIHLERGKYNPSLKLAYDIAKALNASIDELFSYNDDHK